MKTPQEIAKRLLESADEQKRIATNTKRAITSLRSIVAYDILDAAESDAIYRSIRLLEEMSARLKKSAEIKLQAQAQKAERHKAILALMKAGPLGSLSPSERVAFVARHAASRLHTNYTPERVARLIGPEFEDVLSEEALYLADQSDLAPQLAAAQAATQFTEHLPQIMRVAQPHLEAMRAHLD